MKRMLKVLGFLCAMSMIIGLFALPAFAQVEQSLEALRAMRLKEEPDAEFEICDYVFEYDLRAEPEDFGQIIGGLHYTWIHSSQFNQLTNPSYSSSYSGYRWPAAGGGLWWVAPVRLPSGADIKYIQLHYRDNSDNHDIDMSYTRQPINQNTYNILKSTSSTGKPGYDVMGFDPYPYNIFDNYHQYVIELFINSDADLGLLRFRGVRISYVRTISPAPTTATFPDVPTTHGFFRNIEALAASGITTGFSDGTYKPNDYVTRGQMAAFLSRALGLHHLDPSYP